MMMLMMMNHYCVNGMFLYFVMHVLLCFSEYISAAWSADRCTSGLYCLSLLLLVDSVHCV